MNDIARNLHTLIDEAERLLQRGTREATGEFDHVRQRLERSVAAAKEKMQSAQGALAEGVRSTEERVRRNPGLAIAVGVAAVLLAGWALRRNPPESTTRQSR